MAVYSQLITIYSISTNGRTLRRSKQRTDAFLLARPAGSISNFKESSKRGCSQVTGIDKIPFRVIKDCLPVISPWITSFINNSLANNIFPNTWKIAEVSPIPKEGDHELANNNRPISLLPVIFQKYVSV